MRKLALSLAFLAALSWPPGTHAAGSKPFDVEAELVHLRGKRYQVRVISTMPTGGFSKRPATMRRVFCADDCRPSVHVAAPIKAPPPDVAVIQVLTEIRHRKRIRLPRFWKVIVAVTIDGRRVKRIRLTERDAR